jgi:hypothetical protein
LSECSACSESTCTVEPARLAAFETKEWSDWKSGQTAEK